MQLSKNKGGANGPLFWRKDGKELYFTTRDREVMAVDVTPGPKVQIGAPHLLFKLQDPLAGSMTASADGERFVVTMPVK